MVDQFNFTFGKKGSSSFNDEQIKGGVKRQEVSSDKDLLSLFDKVDTNPKDGVLDKKELSVFQQALKKIASDEELSNRETKKYLKENNLDVKKEKLHEFLNIITSNKSKIARTENMNENGKEFVRITYEDNHTEDVFPDGSKIITVVKGNTTTKTKQDKDNNTLEEIIIEKDGDSESTTTIKDGKPAKKVTKSNNGQLIETITLKDGKPAEKRIENIAECTVEIYSYDGDTPVLKRKESTATGAVTTYENGVETTVLEKGNKKTETVKTSDNKVTTTTTETFDDKTVKTVKNESGSVETTSYKSGLEVVVEKDAKNNILKETKTNGSVSQTTVHDGKNSTTTVTDGGHALSQTKKVNGKTYSVQYDGENNTTGVVVQYGETAASLAKKFGCSEEELLKLNGKQSGETFKTGDTIKVPGRLEADDKKLIYRKSSEKAIQIEKRELERKAKARAYDAKLRKLGLKNYKRSGETFTYGGQKYTIIGTMNTRARLLVKDAKGNITVASHDNKILKDSYVKATDMYDRAEKTTLKDGKKYVVLGERGDAHGRMIAMNDKGERVVVSGGKSKEDLSDRVILKNEYVRSTDIIDSGGGEACYSDSNLRSVTVNGQTRYFKLQKVGNRTISGGAVNTQVMVQQEARAIIRDLDEAADGAGTDEKLMSKANKGIRDAAVLKWVNNYYAQEYGSEVESGEYKSAYEAFMASELSMKEVYVNNAVLVSNGAITDQARRDEIIQTNVITYGNSNENLQEGLRAVSNRVDFDNLNTAAAKHNRQNGIHAQFKNQSAINTLIYSQTDGDADDIKAANDALIDGNENVLTKEEITRTRAEQGVYYMQEANNHTILRGLAYKDADMALSSDNVEVYKMMDELLKEKGEVSFVQQELIDSAAKIRLATSGYGNFTTEDRVNLALEELRYSYRADRTLESNRQEIASMTTGNAFSNVGSTISSARTKDSSLNNVYKILSTKESYDKFMEALSKDSNLKAYFEGEGIDLSRFKLQTAETTLPEETVSANKSELDNLRRMVELKKSAFDAITSSEGGTSGFINILRNTYGLGVTRETANEFYKQANYILNQLDLAAEGRLVDGSGKPITFEELKKQINLDDIEQLEQLYQTHQAYGEMAMDVTVGLATMPVGGVGTTKLLGTVGKITKTANTLNKIQKTATAIGAGTTMGVAQYGMKRFDQITSSTGDTMQNRAQALDDAIVNGALGAIGMRVGIATSKLNASLVQKAAGYGIDVTSDVFTSAAADYIQHGSMSEDAFLQNLAFSLIGNGVGRAMDFGDTKVKPQSDVDVPESLLNKITKNTNNPAEIATPKSIGRLNEDKFKQVKQDVEDILSKMKQGDDEALNNLQRRIEAFGNGKQRRELSAMLVKKKAEWAANPKPTPEPTPTPEPKPTPEVDDIRLRQKLGEKLHATYVKVLDVIDNKLQNIAGYNKLKAIIKEKFANHRLEMNSLLERLNIKAKWLNLNVSETSIKALSEGTQLQKGSPVEVAGTETLKLDGSYDFDLSAPEVRQKLSSLKNGESIVVGSGDNADIRIDRTHGNIEESHLQITKNGDKLTVTDLSNSGTTVGMSTAHVADDIKTTFGHQTMLKLAELKPNESRILYQGNTQYVVENINGNVQIIRKNGAYVVDLSKIAKGNFTPLNHVNFDDIAMSSRVPSGKNRNATMGELLTPEQKALYNESIDAFNQSAAVGRINHNANNMLTSDHLIHGTDLDAILSDKGILDQGLVPREITGNEKASFADGSRSDTLTPLCADVWDIRGTQTIGEYFDAGAAHWNNNGESNFLPDTFRRSSSVMVVINKNTMDERLLNNSFNVNNSGRSILFEQGNMSRGHDYPTHRAIPIGVPANTIEKLIVDTRMVNSTQIQALKQKVQLSGLDIKIFDLNGNQI